MRRGAIVLAAALASAPMAARGDESPIPDKARILAKRGRAFHDAGNYSNAIEAFTQAYVIAPSPALLFNLAQAYRLQGNCNDAALMYRRFLTTHPEPEQRALAETHLASVERCMYKLALHIPVEPGARSRLVPEPPSAAVAATRDAPASSRAQIEKEVGIGLVAGGSLSLAIAAYYALEAHRAADDVTAAYAKGGQWKDIAHSDARGRWAATTAQLFGAGGALGIASGIVTYLIGKRDEQPPVMVAPTRHGLSVGVRWTF
jgi:tetratricopeptide (TPR) repeat protein